jgi:hypothetical protein
VVECYCYVHDCCCHECAGLDFLDCGSVIERRLTEVYLSLGLIHVQSITFG